MVRTKKQAVQHKKSVLEKIEKKVDGPILRMSKDGTVVLVSKSHEERHCPFCGERSHRSAAMAAAEKSISDELAELSIVASAVSFVSLGFASLPAMTVCRRTSQATDRKALARDIEAISADLRKVLGHDNRS